MAKKQTPLKVKNAAYLWAFIGANFAVFCAVIVGAKLNYTSVNQFWHQISAKDSVIAVCMPMLAIILNGVLDDTTKARLVFWRWKNPLPGCRAFSDLIRTDPRVDIETLKAKYGAFPRSPKDQNILWFRLYKKHIDKLTVSEGHRLYLLTRDMTSISAVFVVVLSICTAFSSVGFLIVIFYSLALLLQYLTISTSSRNYGNRFVLNVLTEESQAK